MSVQNIYQITTGNSIANHNLIDHGDLKYTWEVELPATTRYFALGYSNFLMALRLRGDHVEKEALEIKLIKKKLMDFKENQNYASTLNRGVLEKLENIITSNKHNLKRKTDSSTRTPHVSFLTNSPHGPFPMKKKIVSAVDEFDEKVNMPLENVSEYEDGLRIVFWSTLINFSSENIEIVQEIQEGVRNNEQKSEQYKNELRESLENLQKELEELVNIDIEDAFLPLLRDLQLHIYRSLGIQFIEDPNTQIENTNCNFSFILL
ncbi:5843_t:CDS:2 [Diversispora eburnea]|uniref:5843_t:CDS:1 n=1 Tax=Diversispora eburnea TaxID=1213867 RepID=A0A9N9AUP0_9GLOM|nr:5843_t:CDS:2 [Diversispora eburnea]